MEGRTRPLRKPKFELFSKGSLDFPLLLVIILICLFGLIMLFSASYYYAQSTSNADYDGFYYLKNQATFMLIGFAAMIFTSKLNYQIWHKLSLLALLVTLALMLAVVVFGVERNGAQRWLKLGPVVFQPSEFAKFVLVIYMASFMCQRENTMKSFTKGIMPMMLIIGIMGVFLLLQRNLSMLIIAFLTGVIMLFLGGCDLKHLVIMALVAMPIFYLAIFGVGYRSERVMMFTDPWNSDIDGAYQLRQSLIALGNGGIFGQGLNFSRQKLLFLPYRESDFIFAIIGEELGLVGCVLLMLAFAFAITRGVRIAVLCKDKFGSLVAGGITCVLAVQVLVNIAVVTSSIPPTGQTLPFISAGGTSLVIFMAAMGILLNVSRNTEQVAK